MNLPDLAQLDGIYGADRFAGGFTEIIITSGLTEVQLRCDRDTDELCISTGPKKERKDLVPIVVGEFAVLWMWAMTNQQGYSDGFRIELWAQNRSRAFDFISIASAIEVFEAQKRPNQSPEPAAMAVTPPPAQEARQP
jgi:hypothetical protein